MATSEQVQNLRLLVSEPDATVYTDLVLGMRIDNAASIDEAAAAIWREKAASYSELVDTSESGSSRKNSQLYTNALALATFYEDRTNVAVEAPVYSTTRRIVRI